MIETQLFPILTRMTFPAFIGIASIVNVIDQMAGITLFGGIFVLLTCMTEITGQLGMAPDQLVFRIEIVIEALAFPVIFAMTLITGITQLTPVSIIRLVTGNTDGRRLTVFFLIRDMTRCAIDGSMLTL